MVEQVERIRLQLECDSLTDPSVLKHRHVDRTDGLTAFRVPAKRRVRRTKNMFRLDIIDNKMRCGNGSDRALVRSTTARDAARVHADKRSRSDSPGTSCRIGAECQTPVTVFSHLVSRQTGISKKRPAGIERAHPGKVRWVAQSL